MGIYSNLASRRLQADDELLFPWDHGLSGSNELAQELPTRCLPRHQRPINSIRVTMLQTVAYTGTVLNFGKEHHPLSKQTGQQGNVYQHRDPGKWNPQAPAYGRFWIGAPDGDRKRRTISLGPCGTQWLARLRLREYIERAGINSKPTFHQNPVPGTTFRQ